MLHIKKQGSCTVAYLSQQLGLTPNAIRQHLSVLVRDRLVDQQPVKVGPSKPALAFSLTAQAESLFPKKYHDLLLDLVQELVHRQGEEGAGRWMGQLGDASAGSYVNQLAHLGFPEKVAAVGRILEESGSLPEWEQCGPALAVRDFNCPYAAVTRDYPQVCEVQRGFLQRLFAPAEVSTACDRGNSRCEFRIGPGPET